jgi:hypothetical protein
MSYSFGNGCSFQDASAHVETPFDLASHVEHGAV